MRSIAGVFGLALVLAGPACQTAQPASRSMTFEDCSAATRERAEAIDAIDRAEKAAQQKTPSRAKDLARVAAEGKGAIQGAADISPCDDRNDATGVVVDIADLRQHYSVTWSERVLS